MFQAPLLTCAFALAAVIAVARPATAQPQCEVGEGTDVCGFVWNDANNNGLQDPNETGIPNVEVTLSNGVDTFTAFTGPDGVWNAFVPLGNDITDSDGVDNTTGSLVPAMLNVAIGNDSSCVSTTIAAADAWMATYGPVGSNLPASSPAWSVEGEPLHKFLDSYNNGREYAPHRK